MANRRQRGCTLRRGFLTAWILILALGTVPARAAPGDAHRLTRDALLRKEPAGARSGTLPQGREVVEIHRSGHWVLVFDPRSQRQGWVAARLLEAKADPAPARPRKPDPALPEHKVTLQALGWRDGFRLEGSGVVHERSFVFQVPRDTPLIDLNLDIHYRSSPRILDIAWMRVEVNDRLVREIRLPRDGEPHHLGIPLSPALVRHGLVQVRLRAALPVSTDRCLDARIGGTAIEIGPETGLRYHYRPPARSVRDAWLLLPRQVRIALPDRPLGADELTAGWQLVDALYREGREISFVPLSRPAEILLARREEARLALEQNLAQTPDSDTDEPFIGKGNLVLAGDGRHRRLLVTAPWNPALAGFLAPRWRPLAAGRDYTVLESDGEPHVSKRLAVPLVALGFPTGTRHLRQDAEWQGILDPFRLPPATRPELLRLHLQLPPPVSGDPPLRLYLYLNDVLVAVRTLAPPQGETWLALSLPQRYRRSHDRLRLRLVREISEGNCRGPGTSLPVQLLPDSSLVVAPVQTPPTTFATLPPLLAGGFDFWVDTALARHPESTLPRMAALTAGMPIPVMRGQVRLATAEPVRPQRPFLALGMMRIPGLEAPLPPGHDIRIEDAHGHVLLHIDGLPRLAIAQLVRAGGHPGLWLRPGADRLPTLPVLQLDRDDVAFLDAEGIVLSLDSREPTPARIHDTDALDWLGVMGRYRFWLIALGWLGLSGIIVYLYRKSREHRIRN